MERPVEKKYRDNLSQGSKVQGDIRVWRLQIKPKVRNPVCYYNTLVCIYSAMKHAAQGNINTVFEQCSLSATHHA
jgi:hypothetical protein